MRRAGGPAGGAGAGPARGPAPAAARDGVGRAGKGGAKGKGEDRAGPRDPSPRCGRRRQRLIGPVRAGRGRGLLLWGRADWPRTLRCRHWRRASGRGLGVGRVRPGLRSLTAAKAAWWGWREELAGGPGGGEWIEARPGRRGQPRAREISVLRAGWPHPRQPLPGRPEERSHFQPPRPPRLQPPHPQRGSPFETHIPLVFYANLHLSNPPTSPRSMTQAAPSSRRADQ